MAPHQRPPPKTPGLPLRFGRLILRALSPIAARVWPPVAGILGRALAQILGWGLTGLALPMGAVAAFEQHLNGQDLDAFE